MKRLLIILLISIAACKSKKAMQYGSTPELFEAYYSSYHTPNGQGKGYNFYVTLLFEKPENVTLDSFIVNNKALKAEQKNVSGQIQITANYFKNQPTPTVGNENPEKEQDAILNDQKFYPSYIVLSVNESPLKININEYKKKNNP